MSKARRKRQLRRRPINVLASGLTIFGLYFGTASIFKAVNGDYPLAAYFILYAIVFDMLDGTVAKLTKTTSEFGKNLDSLCDLVSFGVAPAVLIHTAYLQEELTAGALVGRTGAVMAIIFVICAALRLARFNVYQSELRDFFIGLPVPAAGATIASFVLFTHYFEVNVAFWVLGPLTVILAYLMVSTFRYPKDRMKALVLAPRNAFRMLVLGVVVIAAIHYASDRSPAIVLFPITSAYVLYGVVDALLVRLERKQLPSRLWAYGQEPPPAPPAAKREDLL